MLVSRAQGSQRASCNMSRRLSGVSLALMLVVAVCVTPQIFWISAYCFWKCFLFIAIWGCKFSLEMYFQIANKTIKIYNAQTHKVSKVNEEAKQSSDSTVPSCQMFTKWWCSVAKLVSPTPEYINFYSEHMLTIWQWICPSLVSPNEHSLLKSQACLQKCVSLAQA